MIPVGRAPEPAGFDERVRKPGQAWLAVHTSAKRPRDLWTPFKPHLAEAFRGLCGYAAMRDPTGGTVDHYHSVSERPGLAYEWSNYRFASGLMNQIKGDANVLDPFEVGEGWFEIQLPSLQLVVSDKAPPERREAASKTLERLRLRDDERIVSYRQAWYGLYMAGELTLEGLYAVAPLIAAAEKKRLHEKMIAARGVSSGGALGGPAASPSPDDPSR